MSAYQLTKRAGLYGLRGCGAFRLASRLISHGLQILCYHGISVADEHRFKPRLFMRPETFAARMDSLAASGFRAISLDDALKCLQRAKLPRRAFIITFDDGWHGCLDGAFAKLASMGWPATLYVATYYGIKRRPVFNVAVDYLLWRAGKRVVELGAIDEHLAGRFNIGRTGERQRCSQLITQHGDARLDLDHRTALLYRLAEHLDFDPVDLFERRRVCGFLNADELRRATAIGIDLQLHTHRHRFPVDDPAAIAKEIRDNREALQACGGRDLVHLCYPNGEYHPRAFAALTRAGIKTGTTTDPGLIYAGAQPLAMSRFLDGEHISRIEFQAEMSGVAEVLRRARAGHPPWSAGSPLYWRRQINTFMGRVAINE